MSGMDGNQTMNKKMSSEEESTAALDRAVEKWRARHVEERKQRDMDRMLFEWRKEHGKCPYCGMDLN